MLADHLYSKWIVCLSKGQPDQSFSLIELDRLNILILS